MNIAKIIPIILLSFVLSCTRVSDLKPEGRPHLVVECILTEDAIQTLKLSFTDCKGSSNDDVLSEALITLEDESLNETAGAFYYAGEGKWVFEYQTEYLHSYLLTITVPGYDVVTARTTMPDKIGIKKLHRSYQFTDEEFSHEVGMKYDLLTLPGGPVWMMGLEYDSASKTHNVVEMMATSIRTADRFNATGDVFCIDDYIDKSYYPTFLPGLTLYHYVDGEPIYNKIFRIPSVREKERKTKEPYGSFSVAGSFNNPVPYKYGDEISPTDSYILAMSPSEEYDRYLKEVIQYAIDKENNSDYPSLFSRDNITSNIINGVGIFGAVAKQKLPWYNKI